MWGRWFKLSILLWTNRLCLLCFGAGALAACLTQLAWPGELPGLSYFSPSYSTGFPLKLFAFIHVNTWAFYLSGSSKVRVVLHMAACLLCHTYTARTSLLQFIPSDSAIITSRLLVCLCGQWPTTLLLRSQDPVSWLLPAAQTHPLHLYLEKL